VGNTVDVILHLWSIILADREGTGLAPLAFAELGRPWRFRLSWWGLHNDR
jgi:hypothetical protein